MRLRELLVILTFVMSLTAASFVLIGGADSNVQASPSATTLHTAQNDCLSALVFTRTQGFRHGSIDDGLTALSAIALERGWTVVNTEDATQFNLNNLNNYDVVVFLNTTGDVLNAAQEAAFESYIASGGGFFGVHSATDTEYNWTWYGGLVGAYFDGHPEVQSADVIRENTTHPATTSLPDTWTRTDEWYNFSVNPRQNVNVLLTVDESTYNGGDMGDDHPIAWYQDNYEGGRSIYTAMGHTDNSYSEPDFRAHLQGALEWAANVDCKPPITDITATPNQGRPTIDWSRDPFADWFQLYIGQPGGVYFLDWFDAALICEGVSCSVDPAADLPFIDGGYQIWMQAWSEENGFSRWVQADDNLVFSDDMAGIPTDLGSPNPTAIQPTIQWTSGTGSTWFEVLVALPGNPWVITDLGWFDVTQVGCDGPGEVCSLVDERLNGTLPGGEYFVYVRAWGPGGFSVGGPYPELAPGWQEGGFTR